MNPPSLIGKIPHMAQGAAQHVLVPFKKSPHIIKITVIILRQMRKSDGIYLIINRFLAKPVIHHFFVRQQMVTCKHVHRKIFTHQVKTIHMVFQRPEMQNSWNFISVRALRKIKLHHQFHIVLMQCPYKIFELFRSIARSRVCRFRRIVKS